MATNEAPLGKTRISSTCALYRGARGGDGQHLLLLEGSVFAAGVVIVLPKRT